MQTNYIFMIPIRSKSTEDMIKAYLTGVYSTFRGSKYILSDQSSEFTSKQFEFLAKELGFINVYTSPYTPTGNSIIEHTNSFLKASIRKLICKHQVDWDETIHIAAMVYSIFPHSSAGESHFTWCLDVTQLCQHYSNCCCQNLGTWVTKSVEYTQMLCEIFTWWQC